MAHARTKHINIRYSHFVYGLDGMVADILSHWQKSKHCQKVSVVIYHRVILTLGFSVYRWKEVN